MNKGVTDLAAFNEIVPISVKTLVNNKKEAIKNGILKVFEGPLYDQSGLLRVKRRETLSDTDIKSVNLYV